MTKSIKEWSGYEAHKKKMAEKETCLICRRSVRRSGMSKHLKSKKCLLAACTINEPHNDKTAGNLKAKNTITPIESGATTSPLPAELHSKILTEINLKSEFETMAEKFNGNKKDEDKEKKYKYKCDCGEYFNIPAEGSKCPFCGQ